MSGWCLLHPPGDDPMRWIAAPGRHVRVTSITQHPRAALLLVATGQVDGLMLSHDWWQLDGLIRPFHDWQPDPDPPSHDRRPVIRWRR